MSLDELVHDDIPVNQPYEGLVAEAYDVWMPPYGDDADVEIYRRAIERGAGPALELMLHHADWLTLDLGRTYATIYNPAGSFSLIAGDDDARTALSAWRGHLRPDGEILIPMGVPTADFGANYEWRVRRSATRARDNVAFMAHEAVRVDTEAQVQHVFNKHEVWAADGTLVTSFLRRGRLRYWTREQFEALLRDSGFAGVRSYGEDDGFVAVGHAP